MKSKKINFENPDGAIQSSVLPSNRPGTFLIKTKIKDNKIFVKFPYDPELVNIVKQAPDGKKWNRKWSIWELPATLDNLVFLKEKLFISGAEINKKIQEMKNPIIKKATKWAFKTKPYLHQKTGFDLGTNNPEFFFMDDMGTGKTWTALQILNYRLKKRQINKALIIAPKKVVTSWVAEFKKHTDLEPTVITGTAKKRNELLKENNICLINYALINSFNIFSERGNLIGNKLTEYGFDMLILDESHYVKSIRSKRTKGSVKIAENIKYKILMTGTPITRSPEDIFSQYRILDNGQTFGISFFNFRARYFADKGWGGIPDWQIKPGALDEIKGKMFSKARRVTKKQCLDLPPKNYQFVEVEMTKEQRKIYKEIETQLYTEIEYKGRTEEVQINFLMTKLMKLNQITSGFIYKDTEKKRIAIPIPHNKIKVVRELIEDKKKIVIWALFKYDIENLMKEFQDFNPVRESEWERFQKDPSVQLLIGQGDSGGIGITLTASEYVIYYSQGYSLTSRRQSEDRTHRAGTTGTVTYIDLIIPGTIDEDIIESIAKKKKLSDYLTGDGNIAKDVYQKIKERRTSKTAGDRLK